MAEKGWTSQLAAAAGVAAVTGAAQLGLAYGLGVVVWPTSTIGGDHIWLSSLGWATWIAAGSTVFGAVFGNRWGAGPGRATAPRVGVVRRVGLATAAALGALLTVALIAVPARSAARADTFSPQTIAAGYTVVGLVVGLVIAYWAVGSRPVAANVIATACWLWALAGAAIVHGLLTRRATAGTFLGGWRFTGERPGFQIGAIYWPAALIALTVALIIGALAVRPAVRRGDHSLAAAASGAIGPLIAAISFLVLASQLDGTTGDLQSAYLIAPYAVLTGLAGSALTVSLGQRRATSTRQAALAATPAAVPAPAARGAVAVPAESTAGSGSRGGHRRWGPEAVAVPAGNAATTSTGLPASGDPRDDDRAGGWWRRRKEAVAVPAGVVTPGTSTDAPASGDTPEGDRAGGWWRRRKEAVAVPVGDGPSEAGTGTDSSATEAAKQAGRAGAWWRRGRDRMDAPADTERGDGNGDSGDGDSGDGDSGDGDSGDGDGGGPVKATGRVRLPKARAGAAEAVGESAAPAADAGPAPVPAGRRPAATPADSPPSTGTQPSAGRQRSAGPQPSTGGQPSAAGQAPAGGRAAGATAGMGRGTVAPPPDRPTVAQINPASSPDQSAADSSQGAATGKGPAPGRGGKPGRPGPARPTAGPQPGRADNDPNG